MRWNALAMVVRANQAHGELGGHIASYASAADLFEVGFNHFFRARTRGTWSSTSRIRRPASTRGPSSKGGLSEADLAHYRQESSAARQGARGPVELPAPLADARLLAVPHRFDGHRADQLDLPGALHALPDSTAACRHRRRSGLGRVRRRRDGRAREHERADAGRARGPGQPGLGDQLQPAAAGRPGARQRPHRRRTGALFAGAGWRVIKLVWGSDWDGLFARDTDGALQRAFARTVDGQFQTFAAKDGRYNREHFFGQDAELAALAQGLTDEQIDRLKRGGHDLVKIHAAYAAAVRTAAARWWCWRRPRRATAWASPARAA
jgi:pyruvate dehydrogenase E1 component